ncbi:MAG: uroporphyrinogen-III C-methyltransferase [Actinomycetota bacterium]|nr:uroporphyrinogen-III C-methyltransferase [Actinomycetota bacterium]
MVAAGRVSLVGAGPGDPGLMTARAVDRIASADVIFHDRLIPPTALDGARPDAELIFVGKAPGAPGLGQEEINRRLVESARTGARVVRLKGGDPFLFGRGAEEAEALRAAGIRFEIVPGVTAGVAASATAGIPVTHRNHSSGVAFVTGHEDPEKPESRLDIEGLASFPGTLVFYMGISRLRENAEALIAGGRSPYEPAAVIERGTTPSQRVVTATLGTIAEKTAAAEVKPPSLVVIGDVVRYRDELAWFEDSPLFGVSVVVTRARDRAPGLTSRLAALGAEVIELPVTRTEPIGTGDPRVAAGMSRFTAGEFDLMVFTSPAGVTRFFELLGAAGLDARSLAGAELAAVGPGTARALAAHGLTVDHLPERFVAEGMLKALEPVEMNGRRVLMVRAEKGRPLLPDTLRERGAEVEIMPVYRTVPERVELDQLNRARRADFVTFTSASSVASLADAAGVEWISGAGDGPRAIAIGPVTADAAREIGIEVAYVAERHDLDGLVEAVVKAGG